MVKFLRHIIVIVLFSFLSVSHIHAEADCSSPTDNIILNSTLKDQKIDKPFVVGHSGGEALYYEIVLAVDGRLVINTATDTHDGDNALDTVNTHGRMLKSDCSNLDTSDIEINPSPRYFKFDKVLAAGTYYLRVHNETTLDDSSTALAKGFFQIENTFTSTVPTKQVSITKTHAILINSGSELVYTINVKNEGTTATTSVQVSDPLPTPNHLTYIGVDASTTGWSCVAGNPVVCTLDSGVINYNATKTLKLKYRADYQSVDRTINNITFVDVGYADASVLHKDAALRSVTILKETPSIDLSLNRYKTGTWTGISTIIEGDEFDYRIAVRNNGTLADENVTITDTIPVEFQITGLDFDNTIMNCSSSGQDVTCDLLADLAVGVTEDVRIKVKAIGTPATGISNSAFTTGDTILGVVSDTDTKSMDILAKNAVINITKTRSTANVIVGHSAYYNITVKNNGNVPLTNINVTDTVPAELQLTSASRPGWDCTASDTLTNKVDCTLLTALNPGSTHYFYVYVDGKTVANSVNNTAFVTTAEAATDNESELINVIAPSAGIRIQKSVSPTTVNSLDTFTYTLSVDNNGSESNSNIVVTDTIDGQFTLPADWNSNVAPWNCSESGKNITCNYTGSLASGASATDITIKVQAPYTTTNLTIDNTAVVNAKAGVTLIPVTDSDTVSVNIVPPGIGFFLTKTSNKNSVVSGESYVYTVRVDNNGTLGEQDVVVTDTIPALLDGNFTLNAGNFDCSATVGKDINCKLATLAAGAHDQFTVTIVAPIVASSTVVTNTANATSKIIIPPHVNETKTGSDSATVTINPAASSLSITKGSSQDLVLENDIFSYLITVKNSSIANEHNLTVTDDIHSDLTILSHTGSGWSCSHSGQVVTCTMATLGAGVQADINITVQAPNTINVDKTIVNSAKVVSSKEVLGKTAQKDVTLVAPGKALSIHMTSNPSTVYANDLYYYEIFITNNSGRSISTVQLTETLPAELQYDHYESGGWNCDYNDTSRVFGCDNNGTQFTGGQRIIKLYVIAPNYEANVTNMLSLTTDLDPYVRDANATTEVIGKTAKLIYTKALSDKNIVSVGEDFTYTLKVKNDGVAPLSDINVTNLKIAFDLDQNVSYQSHSAAGWSCSFSAPTLTCTLPLLEMGLESPDIDVTVQGLNAEQVISIANLTADQLPLPQAVAISISVDVRDTVDLDMSLSLSDTPDPAEANSIYYYDFVIRNLDTSKIAKDVIVDINTTSVDDYLFIDYSDTADWDCTKVAKLLTCQLQHDLLADTNETLRLEVKSPNSVTKVELNATLHSIYVNDTNLANNHAYEDTSIMKTDLTINSPREFTKIPLQGMVDMNIFGDVLTIGNQSICEKDGAGNCQEPSYFVNDLVTQEYANLDSVYAGSYKTATSARLDIDASDEIVWAGLYWMGRIDKTISGFQTKIDNAQKVYLRADLNTSGYVEVGAQRSTPSIDNSGAAITVDKFNFMNDSTYFDYQGVADITSYVKANRGDDYWVADIQSSEGDNLSAGWNIVVIVRDTKLVPTRELKNITLFDGFQSVWKTPDGITSTIYKSEVNQTVKGFLTPTTGAIKSNLIIFAFEGDRTLTDFVKVSDSGGVMHTLSNAKNPANDAVNGTITRDGVTVTSRAPNLDNTSGIDVDEFYLGDIGGVMGTGIIDNGQTETSISIGSLGLASNNNGGDRFTLGMFGFSTNLNDPVCYMQTLKNEAFTADLGTEASLGEKIGIEVEFRNIEIQTLRDMHSYLQIDKIFKEDEATFELMNVGEGSYTTQNPLFNFGKVDTGDDNLTEVKTSIGVGATSAHGGDLATGKIAYIRYNAELSEISDDNLTHNVYSVSYDPNPNKKIMVKRCSGEDQNLTISERMTNGFEVTHEGGLTDGINDGLINENSSQPSNENHLFTQVVNQDFGIDIVVLSDEDETKVRSSSYTGLVQIEMIEYDQSLALLATNLYDPCSDYTSISAPQYVAINNNIRESTIFNIPNANKNAGFRVRYLVDGHGKHVTWSVAVDEINKMKEMVGKSVYSDGRCDTECIVNLDLPSCRTCLFKDREIQNGFSRSSCSTDIFAVRPEKVSFETNETKIAANRYHVGGMDYNLTFKANAMGYDSNITASTGSLDFNITKEHAKCPTGDLNGSLLGTSYIAFEDGDANMTDFNYTNIGDINVTFKDHNWTLYDQNLTSAYMSDCEVNSTRATHNASLKVGCNIGGDKVLSFKPARFINDIISFNDFNNGFTYMSGKNDMKLDDENMSARLVFSIKAVIDNNNTATHFDKECYATDINYTVRLNDIPRVRLSNAGITPQYYDLNSTWSNTGVRDYSSGKPIFDGNFSTSESNFTSGDVNITIGLNAIRDVRRPINPFIINSRDINISVDGNGTYDINGVDFNNSNNFDINTTFYYGRVNVPDIETAEDNIDVTVFYELFCRDCNKTRFPLANGAESGDSVFWYINNVAHTTIQQGTFNTAVIIPETTGTTCAAPTLNSFNASLQASAPHRNRVTFNPSNWLIYNKFNANAVSESFNITFFSTTDSWAGKGDRGMTIDQDISRRNAKKMEW